VNQLAVEVNLTASASLCSCQALARHQSKILKTKEHQFQRTCYTDQCAKLKSTMCFSNSAFVPWKVDI